MKIALYTLQYAKGHLSQGEVTSNSENIESIPLAIIELC